MTKLIPMTQSEFEVFLERIVPEYAAENVRARYWNESEALEKSLKEHASLLPQGLQSENHHIYTVYDDNQAVGIIWMRVDVDRPKRSGFIFDLDIDAKFRGRGYGEQAMLLIEEKARGLGLTSLALHVFASNRVARHLYENLGYEVSSLNMAKNL